MKYFITIILFLLSVQIASAQCSNCTYSITNSNNIPDPSSGETMCFNSSMSISGFNNNGNDNYILCIAPGVTLMTSNGYNPENVTFNVYGTCTMNGNIGNNITVNVYNGGTFYFNGNFNASPNVNISSGGTMQVSSSNFQNTVFNNSGTLTFTSTNALGFATINNSAGATLLMPGKIDRGIINNAGLFEFTSTGIVTLQNSNSTINNLTGGQLIATTPERVLINSNTFLHNAGTVAFKELENQDGTITNAVGATMTVSRGFYSHGAFLNNGILTISCNSLAGTGCGDACLRFQNKGPNKQFVNNGSVHVNGSVSVCGGVIVHNNGTINISGNLSVTDNNSGWAQNSSGTTNVTGTTTNTGSFTGGYLCTQSVTGTVTSTLSCGTPPTINNITLISCQNVATTANIAATTTGSASVVWGSLQLKVGATVITANGTPTAITVTNVGTYSLSYTNSAATVSFTPVASFTGSATATYRIASLSGSTTTYSDFKNITTNISARPAIPTSVINGVQ